MKHYGLTSAPICCHPEPLGEEESRVLRMKMDLERRGMGERGFHFFLFIISYLSTLLLIDNRINLLQAEYF